MQFKNHKKTASRGCSDNDEANTNSKNTQSDLEESVIS